MASQSFTFRQFAVHQDRCAMKVGTDGVLLGAWANVKGDILDIGTGTGLIALMTAQRSPSSKVTAIEIDRDAAVQATENVASSPFADRISVVQSSIQDYRPASDSPYHRLQSPVLRVESEKSRPVQSYSPPHRLALISRAVSGSSPTAGRRRRIQRCHSERLPISFHSRSLSVRSSSHTSDSRPHHTAQAAKALPCGFQPTSHRQHGTLRTMPAKHRRKPLGMV